MLVERNQLENLVAELLRDKALLVQEKSMPPACTPPHHLNTTSTSPQHHLNITSTSPHLNTTNQTNHKSQITNHPASACSIAIMPYLQSSHICPRTPRPGPHSPNYGTGLTAAWSTTTRYSRRDRARSAVPSCLLRASKDVCEIEPRRERLDPQS
jgi:hypothetical protein